MKRERNLEKNNMGDLLLSSVLVPLDFYRRFKTVHRNFRGSGMGGDYKTDGRPASR